MIGRERVVLVGHPIHRSLSPLMHNAALEAAGSSLQYEALDIPPDDLGSTMRSFRSSNVAGNVTVPHKRHALATMQKLTPVASRVGAINTFWVDADGDLAGDNTDVAGFNEMMYEALGDFPRDARVAVLGAGGAAAAVVTALEKWPGAEATVHARDLSQASVMQTRHSVVMRAGSMRDRSIHSATIVVNATPLGILEGDEIPAAFDLLAPGAIVVDLNYGPGETAFVRGARQNGHVAMDGLRMLLYQGVAAFHRWFGVDADADVMWQALLRATARA